jgi:hypothetical protein
MKTYQRNDRPQPTSPRIPIPSNRRLTMLTPATEQYLQTTLTWHAGSCGLIDGHASDVILRMYFHGDLLLSDLEKLASPAVYREILRQIDEISLDEIEVKE